MVDKSPACKVGLSEDLGVKKTKLKKYCHSLLTQQLQFESQSGQGTYDIFSKVSPGFLIFAKFSFSFPLNF